VLIHFVTPTAMALFLAVTLEGGKVTAIIWHYYLGYLAAEAYPATIQLTSLTFRLGLVILSLLCSMLFFTASLDRPNLSAVRTQRISSINRQMEKELHSAQQRYEHQKNSLALQQQAESTLLRQQYDGRINRLESLLLEEMNHVVNGIFKGRRYREFQEQLEKEKNSRHRNLSELRIQHRQQSEQLEISFTSQRKSIMEQAKKLRNTVETDDLTTDEQVHDKRIIALIKTMEAIFHWKILPLQFVFSFSILISMLMEAGIMLSFATITVAIAPVLHARHLSALEKETLRVRTRGASDQDAMRHEAAMDRVQSANERIMKDINNQCPA
jgi:uncharacterized membrane protein YciS (DUF1049 family)